jgi:hypothetical protein
MLSTMLAASLLAVHAYIPVLYSVVTVGTGTDAC